MKEPLYKVGIVGLGVVGKGIERLLGEYVVAKYDPNIYDFKNTKKGFKDVDLAIICVPTPTSTDGMSCDTNFVENSCLWLREINFKGVILIKSTIPPSKADYFKQKYGRVVFSPEFMGESKYYTPFWKYPDPEDMRTHMWQVFGGNRKDTNLCLEIFKRKMSVDTQFFQTDIKTASLAKYIENSFFAMKVTFVNEWYDIAGNYGIDWNELRELWLADPRINRNHTLVFPKDRGYGGKCFPKDVKAIIADSLKSGYLPNLMLSVDKINNLFRKVSKKDGKKD
jgi:UDPglucose 6-dehydrogenase